MLSESLKQLLRISVLDDKTISVDFLGSYLDFNFKDNVAKQWNKKILEIIKQ